MDSPELSSPKPPRRFRWLIPLIAACLLAIIAAMVMKPLSLLMKRRGGEKIAREYLEEDVRQLISVLEEAHPDPYIRFGGKVEFNRQMQLLIKDLPEEGLTPQEFYWHLTPFVAKLRDSHTSLSSPLNPFGVYGGGIPFRFHVVEHDLYVASVTDSTLASFIGMRLVSVEGVIVDELLRRQETLRGSDNTYHSLRMLGYDGSLFNLRDLERILPEWTRRDSIGLLLRDSRGTVIQVVVARNVLEEHTSIAPPTALPLPSIEKSNYVFEPLDPGYKTVLLLLENMYTYRETFEMGMAMGGTQRRGLARQLYEQYNGQTAPSDYQDIVAGIPSATELARELVQVMKQNNTQTLIIDLRRNQGGNAFISSIFYYFLHGKEAMVDFGTTRSILIKKYSDLFWDTYPNRDLDIINEHQPIELTELDYDFFGYPEPDHSLSRDEVLRLIEEEAVLSSTFWSEYQEGTYSGYYSPRKIFILCSPVTASSGYAFMYDHYRGGAKVVGTPSSQAGNNFGAWLPFTLDNSGIRGGVSHLFITHFRDDPAMGNVFRPDHPLSYDKLKAYNFDPNAELLLALELAGESRLFRNPSKSRP